MDNDLALRALQKSIELLAEFDQDPEMFAIIEQMQKKEEDLLHGAMLSVRKVAA